MTKELESALAFLNDMLTTTPPESVILAAVSSLSTVLAWAGVRMSPRVALAVGSGVYACLHAVGVVAKRVEPSPACKEALEALEDDSAVHEPSFGSVYDGKLTCSGLVTLFCGDKTRRIYAGESNLGSVLPGGESGREWKRVAKRAEGRRREVIERDRLSANEEAAAKVRAARERAGQPAAETPKQYAGVLTAGSYPLAKSINANVPAKTPPLRGGK